MTTEPRNPPCGNSVERMDRAYREANRLVVAAGMILADAGISRAAPEMNALSAALRAINHSRDLVVSGGLPGALKEMDHAHPATLGRRLRRAVP
jgi:hypothetical protein